MKIRSILLACFWTIINICLSGCNRQANTLVPDIGIPEEEMNSRVQLEAPEGWNTFKNGEVIGLNIIVISDDQIAIKSDGAKIFLLQDGVWEEIPNLLKYPAGFNLFSPSKDDPFEQGAIAILPQIPKEVQTVKLRIVLIGNIYRNGQITDDQTAAYIDVELTP